MKKLRRELYFFASILGDIDVLLSFNPRKIITRFIRKEVQKQSNKLNKKIK